MVDLFEVLPRLIHNFSSVDTFLLSRSYKKSLSCFEKIYESEECMELKRILEKSFVSCFLIVPLALENLEGMFYF